MFSIKIDMFNSSQNIKIISLELVLTYENYSKIDVCSEITKFNQLFKVKNNLY